MSHNYFLMTGIFSYGLLGVHYNLLTRLRLMKDKEGGRESKICKAHSQIILSTKKTEFVNLESTQQWN